MRPLAALLVVLAVLLPGCALPWQEEEDPAAQEPPEPVSFRFEHDFLGNGRSLPFRLDTSTGTVTVRLEARQMEGVDACMPDRTPPRIQVYKPDRVFALEVVAKNAEGSAQASADGKGDCSAVVEQTLPRVRGVWRVEFMGSGNFTGTATVTGAGAATPPAG